MNYSYHNHTARCGHASDSVREYIEKAIEGGIKYMGFSDHIPFRFPDGFESGYRVPMTQAEEYFNEISVLRDEFKNEIDIKIGFEAECYPKYFEKMIGDAIKMGCEYVILGQHFLNNEHSGESHTAIETDSDKKLEEYVDTVVYAIKSGIFTYVAHPDIFNFTGDSNVYAEKMKEICKTSKQYGTPLEINFLGIRDNRHYPNEAFWKIAAAEQCPVTFGFDAHDASSAYDGDSLKKAKQMVQRLGLNYVGMPKLVLLQEIKDDLKFV